MNTVHNPSGCMSIRIRHAHRVTLSQRLASAFAAFAAALAEVERIGSHA